MRCLGRESRGWWKRGPKVLCEWTPEGEPKRASLSKLSVGETE